MITNDDLTRLARQVRHCNDLAFGAHPTAKAGLALADAVLARDAETATAALAYHEQMRDLQQRAIARLRLAMTETGRP